MSRVNKVKCDICKKDYVKDNCITGIAIVYDHCIDAHTCNTEYLDRYIDVCKKCAGKLIERFVNKPDGKHTSEASGIAFLKEHNITNIDWDAQ